MWTLKKVHMIELKEPHISSKHSRQKRNRINRGSLEQEPKKRTLDIAPDQIDETISVARILPSAIFSGDDHARVGVHMSSPPPGRINLQEEYGQNTSTT